MFKSQFIYDGVTRVFHWVFALLFITAFSIGKFVDDESQLYAYHMISGMTMTFTVMLRIAWGFWGTKYAQFSSFDFRNIFLYLRGILSGDKKLWAGHNPASSWAAVAMMAFTFALGLTGFNMVTGGDKKSIKEIHELFANGFLLVVLGHIAGIVIHTLRHRDNIGLSMVHGSKQNLDQPSANITPHYELAALYLVLIVSYAGFLVSQYDANSGQLKVAGITLQLGETDEHGQGEHHQDADHDQQEDFSLEMEQHQDEGSDDASEKEDEYQD